MMDTPEPMFTTKHGSCGVGLLTKDIPYFGGLGLGLSRGGDLDDVPEVVVAPDEDAGVTSYLVLPPWWV